MKFLKLLLASLAFGLIARPLLITEEGTQLAAVALFVILVMSAVRAKEKNEAIAPWAAKLLSPFKNRKLYLAIQVYAYGWAFAGTGVAGQIAEMFR